MLFISLKFSQRTARALNILVCGGALSDGNKQGLGGIFLLKYIRFLSLFPLKSCNYSKVKMNNALSSVSSESFVVILTRRICK